MLRPSVGIVNQIGVEAVPGTAVAANRILRTLNFKLKQTIATKNFRASGFRVNSSKVQHKKMANGSFDGVLDYNSIIYPLSGLFNAPAAVKIGALEAYSREFVAGVSTADANRKTFTVQKGDQTAADIYAFVQLLGMTVNAGQDDFGVSGDAVGFYPELNQVLTNNPTEIPERPVERDDINLYIDNSLASIGTTQVTEAIAESLQIGAKFKEVFFHNRAKKSFSDIVEIAYEPKFSFEMAHNAQSRALNASIADNPTKWVRWEAEGALLGDNGGADVFELIQFDMELKFDAPEELDNDGDVYGFKYNMEMIPAGQNSQGSHFIARVINSLATL